MMGKTHLQIGITASLMLSDYCNTPFQFGVLAGGLLIGSLFPDADEVKSTIGRVLLIVSLPLKAINIILWLLNIITLKKIKLLNRAYKTTGHRGILHTIFFIGFAIVIGIIIVKKAMLKTLLSGFTSGMILHVAADMISGKVALFLPVSDKQYGVELIPTNSIREKLLRLLIIVGNVLLIMKKGGIVI